MWDALPLAPIQHVRGVEPSILEKVLEGWYVEEVEEDVTAGFPQFQWCDKS